MGLVSTLVMMCCCLILCCGSSWFVYYKVENFFSGILSPFKSIFGGLDLELFSNKNENRVTSERSDINSIPFRRKDIIRNNYFSID